MCYATSLAQWQILAEYQGYIPESIYEATPTRTNERDLLGKQNLPGLFVSIPHRVLLTRNAERFGRETTISSMHSWWTGVTVWQLACRRDVNISACDALVKFGAVLSDSVLGSTKTCCVIRDCSCPAAFTLCPTCRERSTTSCSLAHARWPIVHT